MQRRILLQAAMSAAQLSLLLGIGLVPKGVMAAWPEKAFHAEKLSDTERLLFGERPVEDTPLISIEAPDIAENGRNVPITVLIDLPEVETLSLLSEMNPFPLLARARFTPDVAPKLSVRVKLGGSGELTAIVEADGKLYRAKQPIKVTAGGCGG